ncbi:transcriptional regulator [Longispora fulva]|uniref:ArsR family transcriptional regulator n=1 Tax=Longispora fulva TaxID=619741 RepID=A0A8J7GD94_9ACTN|nr:metalloregulator ArsR/SmtB family transcription factor [Longispora fulva]MBG6134317.1 ArsR family transcriptional regulator [Longispora fulva]GIG63029.1 transcriptional regulator [Longispora fulva]
MSKQPAVLALTPVVAEACCTPLTTAAVTPEAADELAPAFKALGDPVRLRLISMIASAEGGEACVCDISDTIDLSGPTISHHLKVLREAGLIDGERRGTWVYYRVLPEKITALSRLLNLATA